MSEFERFALALALTESADRECAWGDPKAPQGISETWLSGNLAQVKGARFMALGRWQMHPAWYAEWADAGVEVDWSWDQAFRAALLRFWDKMVKGGWPALSIALIFHLGMNAFARGERDHVYASRFVKFWDAQTEVSKA